MDREHRGRTVRACTCARAGAESRPCAAAEQNTGIGAYNLDMSSQLDDLTKRIQALSAQEKAALVRVLIDDLDPGH